MSASRRTTCGRAPARPAARTTASMPASSASALPPAMMTITSLSAAIDAIACARSVPCSQVTSRWCPRMRGKRARSAASTGR
jgi:hypothetical protein